MCSFGPGLNTRHLHKCNVILQYNSTMVDESDKLNPEELFARSEEIMKWLNWDKIPSASEVNTNALNFQSPIIRLRQLPSDIELAKSKLAQDDIRIPLLYTPEPMIFVNKVPTNPKPENPPFTREYMQAVSEQLVRMGFRVPSGENWRSSRVNSWNGGFLPTKDPRVLLDIRAISHEGVVPVTNISLVIKPKL